MRAFERAYFARSKGNGVAASEFELNGYGIADLVWVAISRPANTDFSAVVLERILKRRQIFAFEAKLKDWCRALQQAFRYRYFADKAIVVMPEQEAASAIHCLEAFERQEVGLWTFEPSTSIIRERYTPTNVKAFNSKAREKAIGLISAKVNLGKLREQLEAAVK